MLQLHLTDLSKKKKSLQNDTEISSSLFLRVNLAVCYIRAHQPVRMHKPTFKSYLSLLVTKHRTFAACPRHMQF